VNLSERVNKFAVSHYPLIDRSKIIKAEFALSNSACHFNAVAAVNSGRADKVWLVWANGSNGVVHFINSKCGKFFDETWCDESYKGAEYRIIREIKKNEFDSVYGILCATKYSYYSMFGSVWEKIKLSITDKLHGTI